MPPDTAAGRTPFDPEYRPEPEELPLRALLANLIEGVSGLVRQELRLAQAETSEKVARLTGGLIAVVAGLLVGTCAILILLQALVLVLSDYMTPAQAALVVGAGLAVIAAVVIYMGRKALSIESLAPRRTIRSLREDTEMVMEKTR
jgi:uncharacterized membrane protein YqjE